MCGRRIYDNQVSFLPFLHVLAAREVLFGEFFLKIARTLDLQTDELGRMLIYAFGSWMFDGSWTSVRDVDFIWTACRTSSACFFVFFFEMRWIFAFFNTKAVQLDRQYSFVLVHLLAFKMDKHLTIFD